jgi:hypothetical protein
LSPVKVKTSQKTKLRRPPSSQGDLAAPDRDHGVGLLDEAVDGQRGRADGGFVLDLLVERILAGEMA